METHRYLIALGSNVRHRRFGSPRQVLAAALARMEESGLHLDRVSDIRSTAPLGPSLRRFANAAAVIRTGKTPLEVLAGLKRIEREFGRSRGGQPWSARVLDLDIVLWNGGCWGTDELLVPHPEFRDRSFVLHPAAEIVPGWRDPISGLTVRQLFARLTRPQPVPR